jgi:mycothiol synthase
MGRSRIEVSTHRRLDPEQVATVLALVAAATAADGAGPVSEHALLDVRHGAERDPGSGSRDLVARLDSPVGDPGATVVGYGHVDLADPSGWPVAELVVHPAHRRQGVGSALLSALEAASPGGRLRVWAHGRHPGAVALAAARGYTQERTLRQLRRSLRADLPDAPLPDGIVLRPFEVGVDEPAWVALNNRAFAGHPEQGGWALADIEVREQEPWFDPAGFLLAERVADRALLGFHWTKVHPPGGDATESIGEVYVLGVDPAAHGLRLGRALAVAGLRYLRGRGLGQAMLYADDTNQPALRLYERLDFATWRTDVRYQRTVAEPGGRVR